MNPRQPMFYVSSFVPTPQTGDLSTLVASMNAACYGTTFQPESCAYLAQAVGRVRQQAACPTAMGNIPVTGSISNIPASGTLLAATSTPAALYPGTDPRTITAALAALGASQPAGAALSLC